MFEDCSSVFYNFEFPIALLFKDWPNLYSAFISSVYILISNELLISSKLLSLFAVAKVIIIFKLQNKILIIFKTLFYRFIILNSSLFQFSILLVFRIESANIRRFILNFQILLQSFLLFALKQLKTSFIFFEIIF